jgi:hypothetical protein
MLPFYLERSDGLVYMDLYVFTGGTARPEKEKRAFVCKLLFSELLHLLSWTGGVSALCDSDDILSAVCCIYDILRGAERR